MTDAERIAAPEQRIAELEMDGLCRQRREARCYARRGQAAPRLQQAAARRIERRAG